MRSPPPFPWQDAMGFAFRVLHLTPDAFWSMTPRELAAALHFSGAGTSGAPDRAAFEALFQAFPDLPQNKDT